MAFDLNAFLQENRKFLAGSAIGLALFLVGRTVIDSTFGESYRSAQSEVASAQRLAKDATYNDQNLNAAKQQQEQLTAAVAAMKQRVNFAPRKEYQLKDGGASPANQYLDIAATMRERRLSDARSLQVDLVDNVGLPDRAPTQVEDIRRALRGLDLADRLVGFALDARVAAVDRLGLMPAKAAASAESIVKDEVRVEIQFSATSQSLSAFLEATQASTPPLTVESFDATLSAPSAKAAAYGGNLVHVSMVFVALELQEN